MSFLKDTTIFGDLNVTGNLSAAETSGFNALTLNGLSSTAFIRSNATTNLNKNKLNRTVLKNWSESKTDLGSISGTADLSITNSNIFSATILGNTTFTFTFNALVGTAVGFSIILTNNDLGYITWPANVKWPGGIVSALSGYGIDVLSFMSVDDGTTWLGVLCGLDYL